MVKLLLGYGANPDVTVDGVAMTLASLQETFLKPGEDLLEVEFESDDTEDDDFDADDGDSAEDDEVRFTISSP